MLRGIASAPSILAMTAGLGIGTFSSVAAGEQPDEAATMGEQFTVTARRFLSEETSSSSKLSAVVAEVPLAMTVVFLTPRSFRLSATYRFR